MSELGVCTMARVLSLAVGGCLQQGLGGLERGVRSNMLAQVHQKSLPLLMTAPVAAREASMAPPPFKHYNGDSTQRSV